MIKFLQIFLVLFSALNLLFQAPVSRAKSNDNELVVIESYKKNSFSPVRNEKFQFTLQISEPEKIKLAYIEIRSSDNDVIRKLEPLKIIPEKKTYTSEWDGKDFNNQSVPDEAYHPVILITTKTGQSITIDQRQNSGGEEVYEFEKNINPGIIEYTLPVASRMLIRAGIKNGPMLRTVVDWEPRVAGYHAERWSGWDQDKVAAIEQNPQIGYLIIGYQLPDKTIITYGNAKQTYRAYREAHKWPLRQNDYRNNLLARNGKVIRPEFYNPVLQQKSPRIDVQLTSIKNEPTTHVIGLNELLVKISLNELDEIYLDQERYEISFFVDHQFISEEEQGFVPMTWRWSPGRFGIDPGEHILTVNVSGYNGQVGVKNLRFTIEQNAKQSVSHSGTEKMTKSK